MKRDYSNLPVKPNKYFVEKRQINDALDYLPQEEVNAIVLYARTRMMKCRKLALSLTIVAGNPGPSNSSSQSSTLCEINDHLPSVGVRRLVVSK
jgi:hypothetical protein